MGAAREVSHLAQGLPWLVHLGFCRLQCGPRPESSNGWRNTAIRARSQDRRRVRKLGWERIPFAETRNYVERVMEILEVYRARFGDVTGTVET